MLGGGGRCILFVLLIWNVILKVLGSVVVQYLLSDLLHCHGGRGHEVVTHSLVHCPILGGDLHASLLQTLDQLGKGNVIIRVIIMLRSGGRGRSHKATVAETVLDGSWGDLAPGDLAP